MKYSSFVIFLILFVSLCKSENSETHHNREKRALLYPGNTVLQLTMCSISQISFIPSHKVAVNLGFGISYGLPFALKNFYSPMFWARAFSNETSPMMEFFDKFIESQKIEAMEMKENQQRRNSTETVIENDEEENTTTDVITTTSDTDLDRDKRSIIPEENGDITAGEFYYGLQDTLSISGYHEDCLMKSVCELAHHPIHNDDVDDDNLVHELIHFILTPSVHRAFGDSEREIEMKRIYEEAEFYGKSGGDCELKYGLNCPKSPLHSISHFEHINEI